MMFVDNRFFLLFIFSYLCTSVGGRQAACEYNSTLYPINSEWKSTESCQVCQCLPNKIVICRNRTCQIPRECPTGEQLTMKTGGCCPTCSPIRRSCLYDGTAILHNTVFYPKTCLQCRCRDGQMFCEDICHQMNEPNKCLFGNDIHQVNSVWSPIPCVLCQCIEQAFNQTALSVCYIKQCPSIVKCSTGLQFIPGQCCPRCRSEICRDDSGRTYQNGDVWTKTNNCTHCTCRNGSIICTEEICPNVQCKPNEKLVRLPDSCCPVCSHRSMCRFYGNQGYRIYYENDVWYTSACQYCTCRRHNRIQCKSIQCEYQFCLDNEIQETRTDTCCVSCRSPRHCHFHEHLLQEGSFRHIDSCTICTCSSQGQSECYSNCESKGYSIMQLKTSMHERNHTITVADSFATIIAHSKSTSIVSSSSTRSLLFQFSSSSISKKFNGAVLLGLENNSTRRISYRLILIEFDRSVSVIFNQTESDQRFFDGLQVTWLSTVSTKYRTTISSIDFIEDKRMSDRVLLFILIIILSIICTVLVLVIVLLCYQRREKSLPTETTVKINPLSRPVSALSVVEKFQSPDLTTKVTLLTHFQLSNVDFGTDV